jgi:MHS family proline/betaine transporter-like MFS transporter
MLSLFVLITLLPVFGKIGDAIGYIRIIKLSTVGFIVFTYPLFMLLSSNDYLAVLLAKVIFSILVSSINAGIPLLLTEMFADNIRYTGVSLALNFGNIIAGASPWICTYLVMNTSNPLSPSFYLIIAAIIMFMALALYQQVASSLDLRDRHINLT